MPLTVTVLGSAGMFQTRERAASGYLVQTGEMNLWLDAGAGTWRRLLDLIDYDELDGVVLSHRHPDHVTDVFQAFHARRHGPAGKMPSIPLWAPQETVTAVCGFAAGIDESFDMTPVAPGDEVDIPGARLQFFEMAHSPPETLGVRITGPEGVLAYSSDTGPQTDLSALAHDADVFICEATYQDRDQGAWDGHLTAAQAAKLAAACGVKTLVLTHLPPERDLSVSLAEAKRDGGDMKIQLAEDGLRLEVGR